MQISLFGPGAKPRPTDPASSLPPADATSEERPAAPAPVEPESEAPANAAGLASAPEATASEPVPEAIEPEPEATEPEPEATEPEPEATEPEPEATEPEPRPETTEPAAAEPEPAAAEDDGAPPEPPDDPPPGGDEPPDPPGTVSLARAARERYLNYALSVITARALPDVRDGLKPVQRRILYAMYANLRLTPQTRFRKSAAVVGAVMASYHPHGDQSIYDAMVRLAQSFSLRAPLVEGHGNFGSLDGDPPAAMRYTEARLRALALEMVREIDRDTVPFRANYDGTTREPVVLPARVPQLLVNGSTGIAVGMATNIPPHNLREVCRAAVALIEDPELGTPGLLEHIEGPDFPIGGEILNSPAELLDVYATGRGPIKLRSTWEEEKRGRRRYILVTSIPWGRNKATLIEKIGELVRDGAVPQLTDVRDESTDDVRIALELKRGADPNVAMAYLFKHTSLQINVHVNMTVLLPTDNPEVGAPAQVGLRTVLRQFLDFRYSVVERRFQFDLRKLLRRIHILEGFELIFDALDEAIQIVRASDGKRDAAKRLMARFPLDAEQTEAILELKLYRLAKLEILEIREELAEKRAEAARIQAILASPDALWDEVKAELLEVAAEHGDDRRSRVVGPGVELAFDPDAYIVDEDAWVIVTRKGWIKRQKAFSELSAIRVKEGDEVGWALRCSSLSTVTFYSDAGRAYVVRVDDVPQTTGYGEPIQRRFAFGDGECIVGVISNDPRLAPDYEHSIEVAVEEPGADGADDGAPDEDSIGEDSIGEDSIGEDSIGEDSVGEDSIGEDSIGEDSVGEDSVGEDSIGEDSVGEDSIGDSVGEDSIGEDSVGEDTVEDGEDPAQTVTRLESVGPVAVAITRAGKGLVFPLASHEEPSTKNGRRFCTVSERGNGVVAVRTVHGPDDRVCLATHDGRVIVFDALSLKYLKGTGKGVNAIRLGKKDRVIDFVLRGNERQGLEVATSRGRQVLVSPKKYGVVSRGGKGLEVIKRGTLRALPREAIVMQPPSDEEPDPELEALGEELVQELSADAEDASEDGVPEDDAPEGSETDDADATEEPS